MLNSRKEFQETLMADYGQMGMMLAHLTQSVNFLDKECGKLENSLKAKEKDIDKLNAQKITLESQLQNKQLYIDMLEKVFKLTHIGVEFELNGHIFQISGYAHSGLSLTKQNNLPETDYGYVKYDEYDNTFYISLENYCSLIMKREDSDEHI